MIDRWEHLGHKLGECWFNATYHTTYVHIPKNASSSIKGYMVSNQWQHSDVLIDNEKFLVVLRDPIDRWCSGMAQFQVNSQQFNLDVKKVFNQLTFDDHTEQQVYFLQGIDLSKVTFIMLNDKFDDTFNHWLLENDYPETVNISRFNQSDDIKLEIKKQYQQLVDSNPNYMLQLKKHFSADYELIDKVTFYD